VWLHLGSILGGPLAALVAAHGNTAERLQARTLSGGGDCYLWPPSLGPSWGGEDHVCTADLCLCAQHPE